MSMLICSFNEARVLCRDSFWGSLLSYLILGCTLPSMWFFSWKAVFPGSTHLPILWHLLLQPLTFWCHWPPTLPSNTHKLAGSRHMIQISARQTGISKDVLQIKLNIFKCFIEHWNPRAYYALCCAYAETAIHHHIWETSSPLQLCVLRCRRLFQANLALHLLILTG